ncbi:SDR family oxidoreductase [Sphingomonas sp. TDK1]|uniref:SDR family oxidoreductase n=1 Tax=Sphingomonas sp. TDK1 TaxID=453247 RepID=UPI0007D8F44C|nr:SDR family oxidoreductase [Sphingomonas sp. TDK1]OAN66691.1 short chain dehydrogenase [Sphingomonas sp. TDK1]
MQQKIAIVTGGHSGIGLAIAATLRSDGYRVITCGRSAVPEDEDHMVCDIRDPSAVTALVETVHRRHGGLDLLVNNAGGSPEADAASASPRFSERIIALNLLAPINLAQAALPLLRERRGSIVNIASISALRPSPGTAAYAAAKAGLIAYGRSVAHEWGPEVRVNAIAVGYVETDNASDTYGDEATRARIAATLAARRLADPEDIAHAVLFLASHAASYITGTTLSVDGGGERPSFLDIVQAGSARPPS